MSAGHSPFLLVLAACNPGSDPGAAGDPLAAYDAQYATIMNRLGVAETDTTRNVLNKEARDRKIEHQQVRVAFFQDPAFKRLLEESQTHSDPWVVARAQAYTRHAVFLRSWTEGEKARETELLAAIDELRSSEASWTSPDGETEVALRGRWGGVSSDADDLDAGLRAQVAEAWVDHRLDWIGPELEELLRLRNEVARREGFKSYWELALFHRGLTPEGVDAMSGELQALVQPMNAAADATVAAAAREHGLPHDFAHDPMLRRLAGLDLDTTEAEGWFDADLAESRVAQAFKDLGLSIDGIQIYTGPSRYTRPGAYSYPLKPPAHAAVVMSVDSRSGLWPYRGMTHEMGLATWWRMLPESAAASPVAWQPPTAWFEGYGQLFERMVYQPDYHGSYVPDVPEDHRAALAASVRQDAVDVISWYLGCTQVERRLYETPGSWQTVAKEAAALEKTLRARSWDAPVSENGLTWTSFLGSSLMLNFPAYVQNYLYAYPTEATLWEAAENAVGAPLIGNEALGSWLREQLVVPVSTGTSFEDQLKTLSSDESSTAALSRFLAGE
jgi:hypothetical protein